MPVTAVNGKGLFPDQLQGVGVDQYVTKNSGDLLVHGRYKVGDGGEVRLGIGRQRFELDIAFAGFG